MEDILAEAGAKGMYLVDNNNLDQLYTDYNNAIVESERLCAVVDPENKPFLSKYEARKVLDGIINKIEANRTIALLEKKNDIISDFEKKLAALNARTGSICWECEEPHNAQIDLEKACGYFFPGLVESCLSSCKDDDEIDAEKPLSITSTTFPHNELSCLDTDIVGEAMKSLNILGIVWSGRNQLRKAFFYLLAAKKFYEMSIGQPGLTEAARSELDVAFTHNLFYLAQAYGHVSDVKQSSLYCHLTLQRQWQQGLHDVRSALDWAKNCSGIADFYLNMGQCKNCALALASAEKVLKENVIRVILEAERDKTAAAAAVETAGKEQRLTSIGSAVGAGKYVFGNLNAVEIEADLHRRWAVLDGSILRQAFSFEKEKETAEELGLDISQLLLERQNAKVEGDFSPQTATAAGETIFQKLEKALNLPPAQSAETPLTVEFFKGLPVQLPKLLDARDIGSFELAREVFLRAAGRIEMAKKHYVLDGYVTDHSTLLQEHSKLYHYLSIFESDTKRKLAMEGRRVEMLAPLLRALNPISFEVLHKQISYELGEAALAMLDIKFERLRKDDPRGELHEARMKKGDVTKCNEYAKTGIAMFAHFTFLYAQAKDRTNNHLLQTLEKYDLHELASISCTEPDETLISAEEVRPFLNAHFLSARLLTKIVPVAAFLPKNGNRSFYMVAALRRYQWLPAFVRRICERRGLQVKDVFGDELRICEDMVRLLPNKIDRLCFPGDTQSWSL